MKLSHFLSFVPLPTCVGGKDSPKLRLTYLAGVDEDRRLHEADAETHDGKCRVEHGRRGREVDQKPRHDDRYVHYDHGPFPSHGLHDSSGQKGTCRLGDKR